MKRKRAWIILGSFALLIFIACYVLIPFFTRDIYINSGQAKLLNGATTAPTIKHVATPSAVKALYMSGCAAGTQSFRQSLVGLIDRTELNSIVIDIKDFSGMISFVPDNPGLKQFVSKSCSVPDMKEFIAVLHEKGIYVIGRITVFQDPFYARLYPDAAVKTASTKEIWHDRKGLSFLDPGSKDARDHVVAIAKASYDIGFDELNFDYIRYPSDGNMNDIYFSHSNGRSKPDVLEDFFSYLSESLRPLGVPISADLFGMTTTVTSDLNIGQILERALPYFDYIAPMVYPSHYPPTFNGWANPNAHPYELMRYVMGAAVERTRATTTPVYTFGAIRIASTTPPLYMKQAWNIQKLRPWIQDFSLGEPRYGAAEVRAEIKATYDVGLTSWMLWNAGNRYTEAALEPETSR